MTLVIRTMLVGVVLTAATWFLVPGSFFTLTTLYVLVGLIIVVRGRRRSRR